MHLNGVSKIWMLHYLLAGGKAKHLDDGLKRYVQRGKREESVTAIDVRAVCILYHRDV
jgi:hypothetical protein